MADRVIRMTAGDVAADGRLDESKTATASQGDECRAASGVNVVGKVVGDPTVFKNVRSGTTIKLEKGAP